MKAKGIKNLLIDFGGVLINLDRQRCIENFRKLGLQNVDELLNVYHKPDAEIFETVLADANIDPKETFFIDDSEANCQAAQKLGISTYTPQAGEDWSSIFNLKR